MDENGLPITGAGVNYAAVEALNQRELITYFNMFLVRTCTFLNNFSTKCETKLAGLHARLDSIDTSIALLETKLSSVEELKDFKVESATSADAGPAPTTTQTTGQQVGEVGQQAPASQPAVAAAAEAPPAVAQPPPPPPPPPEPVATVSQDERYSRYFKLLKMGVAEGAVKLKMQAEGVNPELLDTPDAPAPPPSPPDDNNDDDNE